MAAAKTAKSPLAPGLALTVDPAWHLARRAAHAATAAQATAIRRMGTTRWVDAQLAPARIDDGPTERFIASNFRVTTLDMPGIRQFTGNKPWESTPSLERATVFRQLTTRRPLLEKLVETWHDHLHIALRDDNVSGWLCVYDREVIRARALGRFADLLYAATTHPAMLRYLDNAGSTLDFPSENLAREFLELHTVGTRIYRERDVKDMAKLLTGFSVDERSGRFVYRPTAHAVGPLTIIGVRLANASPGAGPDELRRLVEALAIHPATVDRVVRRLAVRFVSDAPPASLITKLANAYRSGGTRIAPVMRTLLLSPEFAASTGRKYARPQELLASAFAAGRPRYTAPKDTSPWAPMSTYLWLLDTLGHLPLDHPDPSGYKDSAAQWRNPGAMLARWNAAEAVAGRWDATLPTRPWAGVLGLSTRLTYAQAAHRIVSGLSGFAPAPADRDALAAFFADTSGRRGTPPATARVSADALRWNVDETVRLALASPYMSLR